MRLQAFRDCARQGSIAAAGRSLGVHPSVLSRSIAALEADLGVRLLERTTRRMVLTEAGARYLERIEPLLDELRAAGEEARGLVEQPQGRLRVTASNAYGQTVVAPMLRRMRQTCPKVHVELLLTDAVVDLVAERIDVALRLGPQPGGDLVVSRLASVTMHAVASPAYLGGAPALHSPALLARHPCLLASAAAQENWVFRGDGEEQAVVVDGGVATSNTVVLRRCAMDGLGVAVLPDWLVAPDVASGRLEVVLPDLRVSRDGGETGVWIVYPSRNYLPAKARVFIDELRSWVKETRAASATGRKPG